jgi:hypothetical protein
MFNHDINQTAISAFGTYGRSYRYVYRFAYHYAYYARFAYAWFACHLWRPFSTFALLLPKLHAEGGESL